MLRFLRENGIPLHKDLAEQFTKVLIVDDEKAVISVIRRFIERLDHPFQVEVAMDGYDAGHQVASFRPDVVFLDIRLPGIDGYEVCRRIKQSNDGVQTRVIAMTGYYEEHVAIRITELGAEMCLQKPFSPDDLRRALAKVGVDAT
jgi:CheY-like chemotaxis protein